MLEKEIFTVNKCVVLTNILTAYMRKEDSLMCSLIKMTPVHYVNLCAKKCTVNMDDVMRFHMHNVHDSNHFTSNDVLCLDVVFHDIYLDDLEEVYPDLYSKNRLQAGAIIKKYIIDGLNTRFFNIFTEVAYYTKAVYNKPHLLCRLNFTEFIRFVQNRSQDIFTRNQKIHTKDKKFLYEYHGWQHELDGIPDLKSKQYLYTNSQGRVKINEWLYPDELPKCRLFFDSTFSIDEIIRKINNYSVFYFVNFEHGTLYNSVTVQMPCIPCL